MAAKGRAVASAFGGATSSRKASPDHGGGRCSRNPSPENLPGPVLSEPARLLKSPDTVASWEALEAQEAWKVWTVARWQLIRVRRRAGPNVVWRYAYSLENKGLVWGGSLKVLWTAHDEFGGVEVDGSGSPIVGLRKEDDDDNEDVDSYQEIHFTNNSFPYCEPAHAIPMKARKGGAPTKWVEPVTGSLRGFGTVPMEGFTFFVEHTRINNDFSIPDEEQGDDHVR